MPGPTPSADWKAALLRQLGVPESVLAEVQDRYRQASAQRFPKTFPDANPYVPPPSMFQVDPLVAGDPMTAKAVKLLADLDPATKEHIRSVTVAPTSEALEDIWASGFKSHDYPALNMMGAYGLKTGDIYLNPSDEGQRFATIGHEIGHGAGMDETDADAISDLIQQARGKRNAGNPKDAADFAAYMRDAEARAARARKQR